MIEIKRADWVMIAILGFTWGGTFLIIEIALRGITPFWLAASRIGFASLLMAAIWGARGFKLFLTDAEKPWLSIAMIGVLNTALPFMLLSWGQQYVTSGFAGVSMAAVALIVLPLAHFFVPGEQMTLRKTFGFIVGFIGVVIMIGGQAFESTGAQLELFGRVACISAAACYGINSILVRKLPPIDTIGLASLMLIMGSFVVIPIAFAVEGPPVLPDASTSAALLFLGLVPTAAANLLRVLVIRSAGPTFMSLVNYQVPVWSVVLGALILSEPLPSSLVFALVLILSGVALSQWGALKRLFTATPRA
ncbi:DMT family transporter [Cochlodiniinecator piscidefendens]|uniref:DMT family transporter n=1 Tax=Cochlodiniinecator piscidefendens TaxID=2715756 RepID=UPI001E6447B3|nr:DMT family transporter [Cochlodiniinecator piscidefendens]